MSIENINFRIKNIENITSFLMGIVQMPFTDMSSYFLKSENISSLQNSIFSLQKEVNNFKKLLTDIQSQQKEQQLNLLKEKNGEFVNLQNKLSESEKIISKTRLEIAELTKSISMKEAQNALLTAENLTLKNNSKNGSMKKQIDDLSILNSNNKIEEELKKTKKANTELQNTIYQLKRDLEQAKAAPRKYNELNNQDTPTKKILKLSSEIDEKDKLYRQAQYTISELQQKIAKSEMDSIKNDDKQIKKNKKIMNIIRDHASNFERTIASKNNLFNDKIGNLNKQLLNIKAKLMFNKDLKKENRNLLDQIESAKQLLEFAMQSMANLAGVSEENVPSSYDVLQNSEMLSIYLSDLQAKVVEKSIIEAEVKPKTTKRQQLNTTIDTMNDLMSIMTQQMQNEHEMLMSQISDDKELPSFRKTVMYQSPYDGK
ncbi:hypothetical protein M9Y10_038878 [Tritrichomonas musculus]|uniref:Uncharacterized protein n=1 Tax=Tritrichomonas musculus TaxID=1915356 RepID=A0ABR2KA93_9EUKA